MSVYVGNPLPTTPYERARRALADLRTPSGFVLGDVIARLILDSGIVTPAPSGSDEQGNRPATPDANGVHDTKGDEAVHLVARDASDAPLARTFCGVATNGTGVRHTASLSIVNCAACLAGLCHADNDGECWWEKCPQLRDGEPATTGRHCPLDVEDDER